MDAAYVSALSALAGSAVGALSSFATTWLTQNAKYRQDHKDKLLERREKLYSLFIDEASKAFADAITHDMQDMAQLVGIYSIIGRIRLFAPDAIVESAENVMSQVVATYRAPSRSLGDLVAADAHELDLLKSFSEACRDDLTA